LSYFTTSFICSFTIFQPDVAGISKSLLNLATEYLIVLLNIFIFLKFCYKGILMNKAIFIIQKNQGLNENNLM